MRCVKREKFSSPGKKNLSKERDGSLVTSCRPPGRLQTSPDDRTWNAGVAVRTADGSRQTAGAGAVSSAIEYGPLPLFYHDKIADLVKLTRNTS